MPRTVESRPFAAPDPAATTPWRNTRAAVLLVGVVLTLAGTLAYAGPSVMVVVYRLLVDGILLAAWLMAATGLGAVLMRPLVSRPAGSLIRFTTAAGFGLGALSLAALGLGLSG